MGSLFLQDRSMLAASVFLKLVWGGKKKWCRRSEGRDLRVPADHAPKLWAEFFHDITSEAIAVSIL